MTQNDLNRAVAMATGETIGTIQSRGFSLDGPVSFREDSDPRDPESKIIDWDALDASRVVLAP